MAAIDGQRSRFLTSDGTSIEVASDVTVLALGGASWPRVGSDRGVGRELAAAQHTSRSAELRASNCGMHFGWTDHFSDRFAGKPLKNVAIDVGGLAVRGDAMITRHGIEGGPVYTHSAALHDTMDRDGQCTMLIDLHPDLGVDRLIERLERRRPKDSVTSFLRRTIGLSPVSISLLREVTGNRIPADPAVAGPPGEV